MTRNRIARATLAAAFLALAGEAQASTAGIPETSSAGGQGTDLRLRELPYFHVAGAASGVAVLAVLGFLIARRRQAVAHARELKGVLNNLRESQDALTASETRLRTLLESTADVVWEADPNLIYTYCSPNIESVLGYTAAEVADRTLLDLEVQDELSVTSGNLNRMRETHSFPPFERRLVTKDGRRITVESSGLILFDPEGNIAGFRGVDRDITAKKQLESDARQSQKMEAIGRLAGGIAHDFNNTLTVISAGTSLLKKSPDANVLRYVETIKKAVERSSGMTRQLLAFSNKQVIQAKPLDMNRVLQDLNGMLRRVISEDIEIVEDFSTTLWPIRADAGQIEQMITNLVVNARDAMPAGGKILLKTQNVTIAADELMAGSVTIPAGDYVQLMAIDTGQGMDSATQVRIFEPFFTTKAEGKGTGLGLASVYGIVKQHGGFITVESQIGEGTTFEILLPRTDACIDTTESPSPIKQQPSASVLIVEDEESVRLLTSEVIASQGYQVLLASGREEALKICREFEGPIDLLLSDVILPKGSGPSIASEIALMRPDMKVLFMSGYTDDMIGSHGVLEPEVNLIYKPFSTGALIEALDAVLQGRPCSPHSSMSLVS